MLQKVAHVRLVQRHVLVQNFERRGLLGRFGRDDIGGDGANTERSPYVRDWRGPDRDGRRMIAGGDRRLDGGDRVCQVQTGLGRRRQQRDERADRDDVDEKRNDDAVAPDERPTREQPQRHRTTQRARATSPTPRPLTLVAVSLAYRRTPANITST